MKSSVENMSIVLFLSGRIDTSNAAQIEKEITEIMEKNDSLTPLFDANELVYISSAGLRVLLKVAKTQEKGKKLLVREVSPEVYDIFETTGFTNLFDVQKKLREISVEGCELLGKGGNGSVYRIDDDKIVKVYKPWMTRNEIDRERAFARTAFMNGIPSVIAYDLVKCGECFGIVFEMIKSKTLGKTLQENPEKLEEYVDKYVALAKTLHSTHVSKDSFSDIKTVLHGRVVNIAEWCTEEETALLNSLIDCIPDTDTVIHNDLHPGNIMIQDGELLLIDMPEVTTGPAYYDLVGIYRDMISAPKTAPDAMEQSVGMKADLILKTGMMFFEKYTGLKGDELEEYFKKLGLIYALNVVLVMGMRSERSLSIAPTIMDKLLRGVVIPNEQALRHLLKTM